MGLQEGSCRMEARASGFGNNVGEQGTVEERVAVYASIHRDEDVSGVWIGDRKIDGNPAAHGEPENGGVLEPQGAQEGPQILGMIIGSGRREGGLAKAAHVIAELLIVLREARELGVPHPMIKGVAMDQHQRLACPRNFIIQPCAIDLCKASMGWHGLCPFLITVFGG